MKNQNLGRAAVLAMATSPLIGLGMAIMLAWRRRR
jgi:hypothetical protein